MTDTTQNTTSFKVEGQLYTESMLEPGDAGLFDKQLGELAHVQLGLLLRDGPSSMNQLARSSITGLESSLVTTTKARLRLANASLRVLVSKGFVEENHQVFRISQRGIDALERYPDEFSPLFVQRELLVTSETHESPIKSGWGNLRGKLSRRNR